MKRKFIGVAAANELKWHRCEYANAFGEIPQYSIVFHDLFVENNWPIHGLVLQSQELPSLRMQFRHREITAGIQRTEFSAFFAVVQILAKFPRRLVVETELRTDRVDLFQIAFSRHGSSLAFYHIYR